MKNVILPFLLFLFSLSGTIAQDSWVSFNVDMREYSGSANITNGVFVNGSWNGWCGSCNKMEDPDGDMVYTAVLKIPNGPIEFKFTVDGWTDQEQFTPGMPCTTTNSGFTNRADTINGHKALPTFCYNACASCANSPALNTGNISFVVNSSSIPSVDPAGLYIAGGTGFGSPGDNPLDDSDNDGMWTGTLVKMLGFSSHYTILNGNCPGWNCKEDIAGLPCSDPNNYDDRFFPTLLQNEIIVACYGTCDTDGSCISAVPAVNVTFNIDLASAPAAIQNATTQVYLTGSFNGWSETGNPMNDDGDGTWSVTIPIQTNQDSLEYKFKGDTWNEQELFSATSSCVRTSDGSNYNRVFAITDTILPTFCWESCALCTPTSVNGLDVNEHLFELHPSLVNDFTNITFSEELVNEDKQIFVLNAVGQIVFSTNITNANQLRVSTSDYASGMYFITVKTDNEMLTKRFVVSR